MKNLYSTSDFQAIFELSMGMYPELVLSVRAPLVVKGALESRNVSLKTDLAISPQGIATRVPFDVQFASELELHIKLRLPPLTDVKLVGLTSRF